MGMSSKRGWNNYNAFVETDISKIGANDENILEKGRRNTCPNPPIYRPIIHREALMRHNYGLSHGTNSTQMMRCPLAVKFARNSRLSNSSHRSTRPIVTDPCKNGPKRSSSAQTDISALPDHWRSESHLAAGLLGSGFFTLPSKFVPPTNSNNKYPLK